MGGKYDLYYLNYYITIVCAYWRVFVHEKIKICWSPRVEDFTILFLSFHRPGPTYIAIIHSGPRPIFS